MQAQIERYVSGNEPFLERFAEGMVIEVRANRMPDGGIVTTFTDITASVEAAEALERSNETLERRVRERTEELTLLNAALARAKGEADAANISKTKFLAAASHDILQPLNAARLYVTSLIERGGRDDRRLIDNIDASLEAVEEIFGALLDMSRLDTGAMRPEFASFRIDEMMRQIELEFAPLAAAKGLELKYVPCSLVVRSDRRLLRRLVQNLVSNAIKYTPSGRVLIGCRRRDDSLRIDVYDTGVGIPEIASGATSLSNSIGSSRAPASRAGWAWACRSSNAWRACSAARSSSIRWPAAARILRSRCRARTPRRSICRRATMRGSIPASSRAPRRSASTTSPRCSTAWKRCCRAGAARHQGARSRHCAGGDFRKSRRCRTGCWSTIISITATASRRSSRCGRAAAICRRS